MYSFCVAQYQVTCRLALVYNSGAQDSNMLHVMNNCQNPEQKINPLNPKLVSLSSSLWKTNKKLKLTRVEQIYPLVNLLH